MITFVVINIKTDTNKTMNVSSYFTYFVALNSFLHSANFFFFNNNNIP